MPDCLLAKFGVMRMDSVALKKDLTLKVDLSCPEKPISFS